MLDFMIQDSNDTLLALQEVRTGEVLSGNSVSPPVPTSIRLYCHGCVGMTREWLLEDNITPAETIVEMMFSSMPETLRKVFF